MAQGDTKKRRRIVIWTMSTITVVGSIAAYIGALGEAVDTIHRTGVWAESVVHHHAPQPAPSVTVPVRASPTQKVLGN